MPGQRSSTQSNEQRKVSVSAASNSAPVMGKRKAADDGEEEATPRKKHKKNKHKKRRAREDVCAAEPTVLEVAAAPGGRPLTLKIKLGGKPAPRAASSDLEEASRGEDSEGTVGDSFAGKSEGGEWCSIDPSSLEEGPGLEEEEEREESGVGEEDEEEAWLDAMEMGRLDETGYLPRKNIALTARQRAMLGSSDGQLLELPVGRASKEMTEEMVLKKTEKNRKRRLAAQRQKEKRKAETVRKLLEKQSKRKEEVKLVAPSKTGTPTIRYLQMAAGSSLSLPPGHEYLVSSQTPKLPPPARVCAVEGCGKQRRYCDSATSLALCSLQCYQRLHLQRPPYTTSLP